MARVSLFVLLLLMRKEVCCCNKPTAAAAAIQAEFGPSHRSLPAAAAAAAQNLMMTDRALEVRIELMALEVRRGSSGPGGAAQAPRALRAGAEVRRF